MKELSDRQKQILDFIRRFQRKRGFPPTIRDIVTGCNVSSTSVVDYNLDILEKLGYIRRHRELSRGIELANVSRIQKHFVPLLGQIAAGEPIPVPSADTFTTVPLDTLEVTEDLTKGREGVYALKVKGTSMIDALINDGDFILLESTSSVENGETAAVWLKKERETTLKKVFNEGKRVRLQPANSQMKPIFTTPDNVEIQGRLVAVIRRM